MSEISRVWHPLRDNLSIYGHFTRIESPNESGIPDVSYTVLGCSGWIENKLLESADRCPRHLTRAQVDWAEAEVLAGGRWFLLGRLGEDWIMYDVVGARALFNGVESCPILFAKKTFPVREMLELLAPPMERRPVRRVV